MIETRRLTKKAGIERSRAVMGLGRWQSEDENRRSDILLFHFARDPGGKLSVQFLDDIRG